MKVLHIGEYVQGGVATYIKTLISQDGQDGIDNYLFMSEKKSEHNWKLPQDRIGYYLYCREAKFIFPAMQAILHKMKELQPDIIYCHSTWAGVLTRVPLLFMPCKAKVIYNAHGWAFLRDTAEWKRRIYAEVEKILSWRTDKIINVSMYEYNNAIYYGISKKKMTVIYSGISAKKKTVKRKVELPQNYINLLFVGRLDYQKGIDILLKTMSKCPREDIHLYVIGDNIISDGNRIRKKNTDKVTFLGWMPHESISAWYEACDAVVMPSRWEAFGLVAIEAMKHSTAVLASDRGALPEIIQDQENGYLFSLNQKNGISTVLKKINKDTLRDMGKCGEKKFFCKFDDTHMLKETYSIYLQK